MKIKDEYEQSVVNEYDDLKNVVDDSEEYDKFTEKFAITSFGADYNVDSLVDRLRKRAFYKPDFQRDFVWNSRQASRFVESLLMGLPVPGIFVYRLDNNKHLIIDGLQRLNTLLFFYDGVMRGREFRLVDVREPWDGRTYKELDESDRLRLDDSIIHTTVFKQDYPDSGQKSIYEVFERINTGGLKLSPQEIRVCVNYVENQEESLTHFLRELNNNEDWRSIYGPKSPRLKDEELILRFLAFRFNLSEYKRPLRGFLDDFYSSNKVIDAQTRKMYRDSFSSSIRAIHAAVGRRAFRPTNALNSAVFDSVMTSISEQVDIAPLGEERLKVFYDSLLSDKLYIDTYTRSTSDEERVKSRVDLARKMLASIR